jgi:hypothetical protein
MLEGRRLLATITINPAADENNQTDATLSLREALPAGRPRPCTVSSLREVGIGRTPKLTGRLAVQPIGSTSGLRAGSAPEKETNFATQTDRQGGTRTHNYPL